MIDRLDALKQFIRKHQGVNDKSKLTKMVVEEFALTRDRSVFYCNDFAVRFSTARSRNFSNTVAGLSKLQKFVVCLVTPTENHLLLANSSLLCKVSHSSQELRVDNIRGSFNGSDIAKDLDGIENNADNLRTLFDVHSEIGFEENLPRLVETTNNISPTGKKFSVSAQCRPTIMDAPERASEFIGSDEFTILKSELDTKVKEFKNEILVASLIENVNIRGRVIEYLIAGHDDQLRKALLDALRTREPNGLPKFKTDNTLGDYQRIFDRFHTETDVKTKIMVLSSNPKAYNIDKLLEFLSMEQSVFMFYFVGVALEEDVKTALVSIFHTELLATTITLRHWAGRHSRGVTQFNGSVVNQIIRHPTNNVDVEGATIFLKNLIEL